MDGGGSPARPLRGSCVQPPLGSTSAGRRWAVGPRVVAGRGGRAYQRRVQARDGSRPCALPGGGGGRLVWRRPAVAAVMVARPGDGEGGLTRGRGPVGGPAAPRRRVAALADEVREDAARLARGDPADARGGPGRPGCGRPGARPLPLRWGRAAGARRRSARRPGGGRGGGARARCARGPPAGGGAGVRRGRAVRGGGARRGSGGCRPRGARWMADRRVGCRTGRGAGERPRWGSTCRGSSVRGCRAADLVAAGEGPRRRAGAGARDDARGRRVGVGRRGPGHAGVVATAGPQPVRPHHDVRAVTGEATVAAAGVAAALGRGAGRVGAVDRRRPGGCSSGTARAASSRRRSRATRRSPRPPGHPRRHAGAPVALFPVPPARVLSVEHADDPVPRLDLTPNPDAPRPGSPCARGDGRTGRRRPPPLAGYVATLRVAEGAPRGTVPGLDAWQASAGGFLGAPVRSVSEFGVERGWQNPRS